MEMYTPWDKQVFTVPTVDLRLKKNKTSSINASLLKKDSVTAVAIHLISGSESALI